MTNTYWFTGTHNTILLDGAATGGQFDLLEQIAEPGYAAPPHVHEHQGEAWIVLDGELTITTADGSTIVAAGDSIYSPAGEAHTFQVTSDGPARFLVASAPAGFADFVRAFGTPARADELPPQTPPNIERLTAIAADHGIRLLSSLAPATV
jgi:mannose-6-phosphate isomerase-like protein (cupin superfamily)